ncbi:MAG: DUF721 domain-containing protein [Hyphomicrobiaceae bacterium]|nr:DUF721 domain-containing protein [Hyphomicrobiaceae bacterium]
MAVRTNRTSSRPPGKSVGSFVPQLTRKAFETYGFASASLITDWETIVGADIARQALPVRLRWPKVPTAPAGDGTDAAEPRSRPAATLVLKVSPARALEVQYGAAQIIERINAYFGYRAVGDLRLIQAPLPDRLPVRRMHPSLPAPPAPSMPQHPALPGIADPGLAAALARLQALVSNPGAAA